MGEESGSLLAAHDCKTMGRVCPQVALCTLKTETNQAKPLRLSVNRPWATMAFQRGLLNLEVAQ